MLYHGRRGPKPTLAAAAPVGNALQVADRLVDQGIEMIAQSLLVFELPFALDAKIIRVTFSRNPVALLG